MPRFAYKARDRQGALVSGEMEAASADAVAGQLSGSGVTPIAIDGVAETSAGGGLNLNIRFGSGVAAQDLIMFTRQLYTLVKAGVPIIRGLTGLAESTRNEVLKETLEAVARNLESGHDLSTSLAQHADVFPAILISTVRVGENSGRLDEALLRVSQYLERDKETRDRIKAALRYPTMVVAAIGIAIAIINIWVIPAFAGMFERADLELPWATQVLLFTSSLFVNWWHVMLVALIGMFVAFAQWKRTESGRYRWDKFTFYMPIIGPIVRQASLARFARGFSMSLRSGVPLLQGLNVTAHAVDNAYLSEKVLSMRQGIERGDTLYRTAVGTGLFTPLVMQMLAVGEETGQVDDLLDEVAGYYERDVDYAVQNLGAAIEPVLLVIVGIMVLILALGVFLPMWDMSSAMKR